MESSQMTGMDTLQISDQPGKEAWGPAALNEPDVRPYFESVKLSVAPLRDGAGIKGKINQSMGLGVPVVAIPPAVEGMGLANQREILIADGPEEFAEAVVELYNSEQLWKQISKLGLEKTRKL